MSTTSAPTVDLRQSSESIDSFGQRWVGSAVRTDYGRELQSAQATYGKLPSFHEQVPSKRATSWVAVTDIGKNQMAAGKYQMIEQTTKLMASVVHKMVA